MPKLIDYPRTTYASAWEVADVVDDTGGKCALDTCARKLNRKVSGSFKAIVGSAVKFGLLTSKRELLTTTTLFRRIKHAYDKKEEILFHREAFLTPPLFTQLCRKFRQRELPIQMLDVMLIREFGVEEINAPSVAKAFTEGARMVGLLDENAIIADIDQLAAQAPPRRELANPVPLLNNFRPDDTNTSNLPLAFPSENPLPVSNPRAPVRATENTEDALEDPTDSSGPIPPATPKRLPADSPAPGRAGDAVAALFGFANEPTSPPVKLPLVQPQRLVNDSPAANIQRDRPAAPPTPQNPQHVEKAPASGFSITISGPGINSQLVIQDEYDLVLAQGLLDKIRRQLTTPS